MTAKSSLVVRFVVYVLLSVYQVHTCTFSRPGRHHSLVMVTHTLHKLAANILFISYIARISFHIPSPET